MSLVLPSLLLMSLMMQTATSQKLDDGHELNLAYDFGEDFHVSFAIIAFTSIVLSLTLYAVALGMWFMDPGKDSIIYRMTCQRMKKEQ